MPMKIAEAASERHVLAVTVDNEPGILAKITGLFTARGYNIDSLTVADISEDHAISRITIVTNGPPSVIDQIEAQLERLVPVHKVTDLTTAGPHVERELALIKVTVREADYWDTPSSTFVYAYGYAKAIATGERPNPGDNRHVEFAAGLSDRSRG